MVSPVHCPSCQKAMAQISNDTGTGLAILSFYCRKCNVSYTDRESVEAVIERLSAASRPWAVSRLRIRGCAA